VPPTDYLFDLVPTDGTFDKGSKEIDGRTYARSIFHGLSVCNIGNPHTVEYNLGRKYSRFLATAGLSDIDTRGDRSIQFRADTNVKHAYFVVGRGATHRIDFDVRNAIYLRLSLYEPASSGPCVVDTIGVWGNAMLKR
jgi:hypothetical protein